MEKALLAFGRGICEEWTRPALDLGRSQQHSLLSGQLPGRAFGVPDLVHQEGLEPSTYRLEGGCSIRLSYWCIGWVHERRVRTRRSCRPGAGDGIRTRDIQLGRLSLYQLSYSRTPRRLGWFDSNPRPAAPE